MAPVIDVCLERNLPFFCIHTGQHYSKEMDEVFFKALKIPEPKYRLNIGQRGLSGHGVSTGIMMSEIEDILLKERPGVVIVQGDTNSAFAGALVASKIPMLSNGQYIKLAHVEAGLRSYDKRMPEELNRIMIDHIADFLFVPTDTQKNILRSEGVSEKNISVVGNTIVDSVENIINNQTCCSGILESLGVGPRSYLLLTLHRQENVDDKNVLSDIVEGVRNIYTESNKPIIFSAHPRTEKKLLEFGIDLPPGVRLIKPVDYIDFLSLEANAALILTDSGGVQEEACILKVPCVTLRNSTERPETVDVGANLVAGTNPDDILNAYKLMVGKEKKWINPFGDGKSAKRIIDIICLGQ